MCDRSHVSEQAILCARGAARSADLVARKSRWRVGTIDNYGEFMLVDPFTNIPAAGFRYDLSAEEVIEFCKGESDEPTRATGNQKTREASRKSRRRDLR